MPIIEVSQDDHGIIQAIKENAGFATDEEAMALLTEVFLVLLIAPEKRHRVVKLLEEPRFAKLRDVCRSVWFV